ncbi:putative OmpL-like beta-barrel porin-2 [Chitinophaga niastensis]|uniref:Putative OmpL-like beta-barrel porin-2 n=2 Tax=Chitinophaga niastensis TaxID=536980 RepID=A0A2P8HTK5_CHINA|nr:putative OmpL-like beta-barrel porin-2 [Chitinophaga niastensis]
MLTTLFAVGNSFVAMSQSTTDTVPPPAFKLSGSADVYYKYNLNGNYTDNKTSFTNSHNSFELGMVSLKVEHGFKKGSIVADLGFGKRAGEFSYNDVPGSSNGLSMAIKQLYVSYQLTEKIKVSLGSYATHIGYELVDAYANRNYSMSYMFSNGPFFNTGAKVDITLSSSMSAMVGVFNPTDLKSVSQNSHKYIGAQLGWAPAETPVKLYLNYLEGKDTFSVQNHQVDLVATYQVNKVLGLGYNGTYSAYLDRKTPKENRTNDQWWGSALYVNMDFTDKFGLTLRGEYFSDKDGVKVFAGVPGGGNVTAGTLSFNYKAGNLTIIPEFRVDKASVNLFNKSGGKPADVASNVLLAATYHF